MLDLDTTEQHQAAGEIVEPAKRWRSLWRVLHYTSNSRTGCVHRPGEKVWGTYVWPSKEVCEEKALRIMEQSFRRHGKCNLEHLGAHPVDA